MKIQYDNKADAIYIKLGVGSIDHTIKINRKLFVDVDKKNNVLGIELVAASTQVALKTLGKISLDIPVMA